MEKQDLTEKQRMALEYFLEWARMFGGWRGRANWWAGWIRDSRVPASVAKSLETKGLIERRDTGRSIGHSNPSRVARTGDIYQVRHRIEYRINPKAYKTVKAWLQQGA